MFVCKLVCTYQFRQVKQIHKRHVIMERYWWWEGIALKSGAPGGAGEGFVAWKWATVLRRGDQHDKDRRAERTQRELGSTKGKHGVSSWSLEEEGQMEGREGRCDTCNEAGKATLPVRFGWTRKWRENEILWPQWKEEINMTVQFICSQSVAEKSLFFTSVSNPQLREQQSYEGKRMPSDSCDQEK